jgi:hypothetical protein
MTKLEKLNNEFENCCNQYIDLFVKKQGYEFDGWICDEPGGIAVFIGQYFFNLEDIKYDLDHKCKKWLIFQHQDDVLDGTSAKINYKSYAMGLRISK